MIYRLQFEKRDEVKYIGHLDTMRTFTRCIKRTTLPVQFSSGFNPRVQLSFALPLAVGVTSECEYVDLELCEEVAPEVIQEELEKVLPAGFKIRHCEKIEKGKSLMALVKEAVYEIYMTCQVENMEEPMEALNKAFSQEEILVVKQGKAKREETINIKPMIKQVTIEMINYCTLRMTVHGTAGSKDNLNPNFLVQVAQQVLGEETIEDYDIHRKKLILEGES